MRLLTMRSFGSNGNEFSIQIVEGGGRGILQPIKVALDGFFNYSRISH